MTAGVAAPVLPPPSVALLESVLSLGSAEPEAHRAATGLEQVAFDRAVTDLVERSLVRLRRTEAGVVRLLPGTPQAVQSFVAVGGLVPQRARRLIRSRDALREVLRTDAPAVGVERVVDPDRLTVRINDLTGRTGQEAISVLAGPPPPDDALAAAAPIDLAMLDRGVTVINIRPLTHLESATVRASSEHLVAAGGRVRFVGSTPHRIVVFDRRTAVVPLDNGSPRLGALIITQALLVRSLHFLAVSLFRHGRPYDEVAESDQIYRPTAVDLRVLGLMNSGVTDQVAAREMGVTDRQFRRYVAQILEQLGASSRFQAGVRAYERGWL